MLDVGSFLLEPANAQKPRRAWVRRPQQQHQWYCARKPESSQFPCPCGNGNLLPLDLSTLYNRGRVQLWVLTRILPQRSLDSNPVQRRESQKLEAFQENLRGYVITVCSVVMENLLVTSWPFE